MRRRSCPPASASPWRRAIIAAALILAGCVTDGSARLEMEGDDGGDVPTLDGALLEDMGPDFSGEPVELGLRPPRCRSECCRLVHVGPPEITRCLDPDEDEVFRWAIQNLAWESGLYPSCCPDAVSGPYYPQEEESTCAYLVEGQICD